MHGRRKRALWVVAAMAAALLCLASGYHVFCRTRTITVSSSGGGGFLITPASLREAITDQGECRIAYRKGARSGEILITQGFLDAPSLVIASTNGSDLLCLYSTDTHLCLLKITPQQMPKPFAANSDLKWIVRSSFCAVESGDLREWNEVREFLRNAPQEQYLRQAVLRYERRGLLESVEYYMKLLEPVAPDWLGGAWPG